EPGNEKVVRTRNKSEILCHTPNFRWSFLSKKHLRRKRPVGNLLLKTRTARPEGPLHRVRDAVRLWSAVTSDEGAPSPLSTVRSTPHPPCRYTGLKSGKSLRLFPAPNLAACISRLFLPQ